MKTKQKQERVKEKWEKALEHYEFFEYDRGEVENYYWNELCPRCRRETNILCNAPYCRHCNWDSLHDDTYTKGL